MNSAGYARAGLGDFGSVNVLVGRNGYGRSTILEAIYVALTITEGVEYVVRRRGWFGPASVHSLFFHGGADASVGVLLRDGGGEDAQSCVAPLSSSRRSALKRQRRFP